jgi:hypothetical protein
VVLDETDDRNRGVIRFDQFFHNSGIIHRCTPLPSLDRSPTS